MQKKSKMTTILLVLGLVVLVTGAFFSRQIIGRAQLRKLVEKEKAGQLTFDEHIKLAKARGNHKIEIPGIQELYPIPGSLDEALSGYSAIIAKPIQRVGLLVEPGEIATWVKFKVSETISNVKRDPAQYALGFAPPPPADILPVDQGEILVFHGGGTATIDGIEITSVESGFPRFDDDNLYWLCCTNIDPLLRTAC